MAEWYYAQGNVPKGPVSAAEIKRLATAGDLAPSDLVWKEGMTDWSEASSAKELFPDGVSYSSPSQVSPPRPGQWRHRAAHAPAASGSRHR